MSTPEDSSDAHRPDVDDRIHDETSSDHGAAPRDDATLDHDDAEAVSSAASRSEDRDDHPEEVELEPGSRAARLYELLAVDLWWSLGMMGASGVIATILFIVTALGPLRVAGIAVGTGTALVYAGRLIWLRGAMETSADEWAAIVAEAAALILLTEVTAAILDIVGGGLL